MKKTILGAIATVIVYSVPIAAQWPKHQESGVPRDAKGAHRSTRRRLERPTASLISPVLGRELTGTLCRRSLPDYLEKVAIKQQEGPVVVDNELIEFICNENQQFRRRVKVD